MKSQALPLAVILGVVDTGYGIIRSLSEADIPMIGVNSNFSKPEIHTRLCKKIYCFNSEEHLLEILIKISGSETEQPILFISSDPLVEFCRKNFSILKKYFRFDLPTSDVVNLLLEKDRFGKSAKQFGFDIPKSYYVKSKADFESVYREIPYPCVLKPVWRKPEWNMAGFEKAYILNSWDALLELYERVSSVESNLIIQEWIDGLDASVYFELIYFDSNSQCLASFSGRKIRQWPPVVGSTSSAEPIDNPALKKITIDFFSKLKYSGFGSIEFKKSATTGRYYVMEPTVGRADHQSYIATANGLNIPLIAYSSLTGNEELSLRVLSKNKKPTLWIDEQYELGTLVYLLRRRQIKFFSWLVSLKGKKVYRFWNWKDPLPAFFSIFSSLSYFKKVLQGKRKL